MKLIERLAGIIPFLPSPPHDKTVAEIVGGTGRGHWRGRGDRRARYAKVRAKRNAQRRYEKRQQRNARRSA